MHVSPQSDTGHGRLLRSHSAAYPAPTLRAQSKGMGCIKKLGHNRLLPILRHRLEVVPGGDLGHL
jgi:hypothetical protein